METNPIHKQCKWNTIFLLFSLCFHHFIRLAIIFYDSHHLISHLHRNFLPFLLRLRLFVVTYIFEFHQKRLHRFIIASNTKIIIIVNACLDWSWSDEWNEQRRVFMKLKLHFQIYCIRLQNESFFTLNFVECVFFSLFFFISSEKPQRINSAEAETKIRFDICTSFSVIFPSFPIISKIALSYMLLSSSQEMETVFFLFFFR